MAVPAVSLGPEARTTRSPEPAGAAMENSPGGPELPTVSVAPSATITLAPTTGAPLRSTTRPCSAAISALLFWHNPDVANCPTNNPQSGTILNIRTNWSPLNISPFAHRSFLPPGRSLSYHQPSPSNQFNYAPLMQVRKPMSQSRD